MVASANFSHSQEALERTFTMSNICPQSRRLNTGAWKALEQWIRSSFLQQEVQTEGQYSEVIIVTGPAFLPVQCGGEFIYANKTIGMILRLSCRGHNHH
jgi:DNA/RNA endonuclease G (NUC1)